MNELEEYIEKLQNLDRNAKIKIMWIGVPIVMAVIIFIWLSFSSFGSQEEKIEPVAVAGQEEVSAFQVLKNGFMVTLKEAGNLLKDFKEKINQTNTFIIEPPVEKTSDISTTSPKVATTTTN